MTLRSEASGKAYLRLVLFLVVFLQVFGVSAREVSIAVFDGAAPIVFTDENGEASGIIPELLSRILEDLGHEPRFVTGLTFATALETVGYGHIDLLPGAVYTEDRDRSLDFNTEPLVVAWGQLGVLPNRDFESLLDLRDRRIGLMRGGQNASNFLALMRSFDISFERVYYDSFPEITEAIRSGEVAAGVFFNAWFRGIEDIVPSSIVFAPTRGFVASAEGKNRELLQAIDRRLTELKASQDSYYYDILSRWLSNSDSAALPTWFWIILAAIVGALVILALFLFFLRKEVRRATAQLRESEKRYRTVANYAHGWEFWADPMGNLLYVSPNTVELTGYTSEDFLKKPGLTEQIILPDDRPAWREHLASVQGSSGEKRELSLFRIRRKDGEVRWMEHRCTRAVSPEGTYLGHRGTNIDVTDRIEQQQELEKNLREKELMLKEIHHRVKNNLQMVASLISLQQHNLEDPRVLGQLESISGRVSTMASLHSTIYREDSFGTVNMKEYADSILAHLIHTVVVPGGVDCVVEVEPIELELGQALPCGLIINEALTNAFKHAFPTQRSGKIVVRMSLEPENSVLLTVSDNGTGMAENNGGKGGSGIGFSLIETLALQLHGELIISQEGGVTVGIRFPRQPD